MIQKVQKEMVDDKLTWDAYAVTPISGTTVTVGDTKRDTLIYVNPADSIAELNLVLPTNEGSIVSQTVCFQFSKSVAELHVSGATTIYNSPPAVDPGVTISFKKSASNVWMAT